MWTVARHRGFTAGGGGFFWRGRLPHLEPNRQAVRYRRVRARQIHTTHWPTDSAHG